MRFGNFLFPASRDPADDQRVIQETLAEAQLCDALGMDMLYVAVPVRHPSIAVVRLALPLTDIQRQLRAIWLSAASALLFSAIAAAAMAWVSSTLLVRRLDRLADGVRQYATASSKREPEGAFGRPQR